MAWWVSTLLSTGGVGSIWVWVLWYHGSPDYTPTTQANLVGSKLWNIMIYLCIFL